MTTTYRNAALLALMTFSVTALSAAEPNPEKDVFFGTTHGHSNWSIDVFNLKN